MGKRPELLSNKRVSLLDIVKRYPEQIEKMIRGKRFVPREDYERALELINHIDAMVESPDTTAKRKIECIKVMILDWSKEGVSYVPKKRTS